MKYIIALFLCLSFVQKGQAQDLKPIYNNDISWNVNSHQLKVTVKNQGNRPSKLCMLYADLETNNIPDNSIGKVVKQIPVLAPNESVSFLIDYNNIKLRKGYYLKDGVKINLQVDAKNQANETDESNNQLLINLPSY
jgi:hypothetical protein